VRSARGQASLEYTGVLLLTASVFSVALAAAGVLGVPSFARPVVDGLRHGICRVAGGICSVHEARAAGLAACPIRVRSNQESAGVKIEIVRVGRDDALAIERRSDGTVSVSFLDGVRAGAEAGIGLQLGGRQIGGRAGAGVQVTGGKTWEFADWAAARRFIGRYARHETLTGHAKELLCFGCGDDPPPADVHVAAGGLYAEGEAKAKLDPRAGAALEAALGAVLGTRTDRHGRRTIYARVSSEGSGSLGVVVASLATGQESEVAAEVTTDHGRPVELRFSGALALRGELQLLGHATDLGRLAARLREASAGAGRGEGAAAEVSVALDLRDPVNRAALASPAALARRLDAAGAVDVRVFRARSGTDGQDLDAGVAALGYERTERTRDLVAAWSALPGGTLQEREDCVTASHSLNA
jgi:hypothetical protein